MAKRQQVEEPPSDDDISEMEKILSWRVGTMNAHEVSKPVHFDILFRIKWANYIGPTSEEPESNILAAGFLASEIESRLAETKDSAKPFVHPDDLREKVKKKNEESKRAFKERNSRGKNGVNRDQGLKPRRASGTTSRKTVKTKATPKIVKVKSEVEMDLDPIASTSSNNRPLSNPPASPQPPAHKSSSLSSQGSQGNLPSIPIPSLDKLESTRHEDSNVDAASPTSEFMDSDPEDDLPRKRNEVEELVLPSFVVNENVELGEVNLSVEKVLMEDIQMKMKEEDDIDEIQMDSDGEVEVLAPPIVAMGDMTFEECLKIPELSLDVEGIKRIEEMKEELRLLRAKLTPGTWVPLRPLSYPPPQVNGVIRKSADFKNIGESILRGPEGYAKYNHLYGPEAIAKLLSQPE